ncbi:MAG: peptidylprolyl isomerase [Asticcacaulis sp.]|nr:peptidylprolyl isomerase [Asticcacaulis sp.]
MAFLQGENGFMISILREFTKTWAFKGLMLLLVIGFAIFGVGKFGGSLSTTGDNIVVAGDHTVTPRQFKSMFDNYRQQYEQQAGESLDNDKFVEAGQHLVLINQLADQTALSAWLDSLRVKPSAKLVVSKLAEIPVFLNSVTGRFDKDTYKQFLTNRGIVVADFEAQQRDELAQKQFIDSLTAGLKAPRIYNTAYTTYSLQSRDSTVFILTAKNVPPPPAPTDAELNAFYNENLERLKTPELRQAAAVIFSASNYEKDVVVDESELHKMFEQQRSTLVTPETRSFIQVTAPDMGAAKKIADGLKAGQSADAVAK